ncbi:uncharacterized protein LOC125681471 [Ostrea edulis]|uniref:uncharacterized protein LOC125681471 n=1 Tax=Ostrea edulis TaxID=37623 RepID=UPI002095DE03|nr:uncharacterized protein LOC125681471 [Ostrea edulis]XP_056012092.1 uncharacterized protein LOC125681471 [Ostrea edulis]XP_056012093.1 uncharacterized protein LOC125681471 [Ostrea edulis]
MGNSQTGHVTSGLIPSTRSTVYSSSIDYDTASLESDSDTDLPFRFSFTRLSNLPPLPGVHPLDYKAYMNTPSISTVSTKQSQRAQKFGRQTTFHLPLITSHVYSNQPLNNRCVVTVKEKPREKKNSKKTRKKKGTKKKKKIMHRL